MRIHDLIRVEISSRKDTKKRQIDEHLGCLDEVDILLIVELSRLGRNMDELIGRSIPSTYATRAVKP